MSEQISNKTPYFYQHEARTLLELIQGIVEAYKNSNCTDRELSNAIIRANTYTVTKHLS